MEGAVQSLATNVAQLLSEEYKRLRGLGGEIAELRDDMATMNALIHMQSQADDRAVDSFTREWMKQLREAAFDADNCIEKYMYRVRRRPNDGVRTWGWLKHLFKTLYERHHLAGEISALRARTTTICERHARYGINLEALRNNPSLSTLLDEPRGSASSVLHRADRQPTIIGIGDSVETVARSLTGSGTTVFSIVGMGGAGKTTLAMEVCRRLEAEFPYQAMVSVSQAFEPTRDLKKVLNTILQQVVTPRMDDCDKGVKEEQAVCIEELARYLSDKRYLIVIDDVWTREAWESIQFKLLEVSNNCGGRIIVTTRIETVADACSSVSDEGQCIYRMKALEFRNAKTLFLIKTFGKMDAYYPEELKDVMASILRKCGGMPLAIVSVANILAGYRSSGSREKWEIVCRLIGSSHMESNPTLEGMRHIVALSYNHLPHELKACMMYLSIFPEDYVIDKKRLLSRWIAEGLIPEKRGWTLLEVAESCLNELLRRNMVVACRIGHDGKVESCQVHDVLLEVMVSKSLESNFVSLLGGQYKGMSYDRIRRLSIQGDDRELGSKQYFEPKKKKMGCVVVSRNSRHALQGMDVGHVRSLSMFQVGVRNSRNLLDHLDKFTLLRVLDLEDCEGLTDDHMKYICRLYLLKFLSLKGTGISQVPPQVDKMEHLQTFDVCHTNLRGLPESVTNLVKLERLLFLSRTDRAWRLPRGLSKIKGLRELQAAILGNDIVVAQEIGELEKLQEIWLFIDSASIGDNTKVLRELARSLSRMHSLRSLSIGDRTSVPLEFLHDLPTPPRLLRFLRIFGKIGGRLPYWIWALTNLVEISISGVGLSGDEPFGILCKLPNLRSIYLGRRYYTDNKLVALTRHNFPVLANLSMGCGGSDDDPMPSVFQFDAGSMSKLETLELDFYHYDKSIEGIEHLTKLREVRLKGTKSNPAVHSALEQLKRENGTRTEESMFQVVVKYW